jgi:hypothetical protein
MDSVRKKGDTSRATMKLLGVSMNDIGKGNTQQIILQIADRFEKMTNPMQRAALAQKLFGRSSQALLPLLMKGRKGIEDALNEHIKYGDVLGGKNVDDTKKLIAQERAMKAAMHGVQITLGTALMPAILGVVGAIVKLVNIFQPLIRQGWLVKTMLGVLVIAFIAYKGAVVAATIASWGLSAATWASIGIWVLVIAAIIAVGVAVYLAYKKFAWFRHGVQFVWQELKLGFEWVKSNWPLLLGILVGPFGLAAVLIITHFKTIKKFVVDVIDVGPVEQHEPVGGDGEGSRRRDCPRRRAGLRQRRFLDGRHHRHRAQRPAQCSQRNSVHDRGHSVHRKRLVHRSGTA